MAEQNEYPKLSKVIEQLGQYFNVRSKSDFINKLIANANTPRADADVKQSEWEKRFTDLPANHLLGALFLSATEGANTIGTLIKKLDDLNDSANQDAMGGLMQVLYEPTAFTSDGSKACALRVPKGKIDDRHGWSGTYSKDALKNKEICGDVGPDKDQGSEAEKEKKEPTLTGSISALMWDDVVQEASAERRNNEASQPTTTESKEDEMTINKNPPGPATKFDPQVACFLINDPDLSPATRDSAAVSLFLSYIPSLEMSRCLPYLDIQIISGRAPVEGDEERISTLSLSQFLLGMEPMKGAPDPSRITTLAVNSSLLNTPEYAAAQKEQNPDLNGFSSAGMELFTSPQLLVNANDFSGVPDMSVVSDVSEDSGGDKFSFDDMTNRSARVIDRFRPLASVTGFSVDVTPTGGMMSHKTAQLSLTLHDRSRLSEISQLIRPDMYGDTELLVEYGWTHPDAANIAQDDVSNPFATFISSMNVREKFKIKNSSFSFDESGQVEITVDLYTVSMISFDTNDISKGPGVKDSLKEFQRLTSLIRTLRRKIEPPNKNGSSNATGDTWLANLNSPGAISGMDKEAKKAMKKWRKDNAAAVAAGTAGPATAELHSALEALLGDGSDPTSGALGVLTKSIEEALQGKDDLLRSPNSGDPFWRPILHDEDEITVKGKPKVVRYCNVRRHVADPRFSSAKGWSRKLKKAEGGESKVSKRFKSSYKESYVSFGKLLMTYVIPPLATDQKFDEVQVFFYTMNEHAAFMSNQNIAMFPIHYEEFKKELGKLTTETAYVPLRRFLGMLQSKFLSKSWNPAYGMAEFYKADDEGAMVMKDTYKDNPTALHDQKQARLQAAYYTPGTEVPESRQRFKKPRIALYTEVKPAMAKSEDGRSEVQQTILKIHIYDKSCTPHSTMMDLLKSARNDSMGKLNILARDASKGKATDVKRTAKQAELVKALETSTLIEAVDKDSNPKQYKVKGGFPAIKNFVRHTMPSIIYGSQYSGVISASVSSMNDPQMATIHMLRSGKSTSRSPAATKNAGLPLRVSPVEVDISIFGCPIINYGQQFFVDFGTGTTIDNIYAVTGISHSLASGEFTTDLKLTVLDAYGSYESTLNLISKAFDTTGS